MSRAVTNDAFAFEALDGGGVLLDLRSGQVRILNRSAAFIWDQHLGGAAGEAIVEALVRVFDVDRQLARRDVATCLAIREPQPPRMDAEVRAPEIGVPIYRPSANGYCLFLGEKPLMETSPDGGAIRTLTVLPQRELQSFLRVISPKLAALRGIFILHASAIRRSRGDVVAFSGSSEAGKTTTAHSFARAGNALISEDKLVLRAEGDGLAAVLDGERALERFMAALQPQLSAGTPSRWVEVQAHFDDVASGEGAPLAEVALLSAERRLGTDIDFAAMAPAQAAARMFENVFVGSESPKEWVRDLRMCALAARTARVFQATMPMGLLALEEAARRYTAITAS